MLSADPAVSRGLKEIADFAIKAVLIQMGSIPQFISRSQAEQQYGQANITRWIAERKIHINKSGKARNCRCNFSRLELMEAAKAENADIIDLLTIKKCR